MRETKIANGTMVEDKVKELKEGVDIQEPSKEKPPLGLVPKRIRQMQRLDEIGLAMIRYIGTGTKLEVEWLEEYNELIDSLNGKQ